jgi:hypothetical protein
MLRRKWSCLVLPARDAALLVLMAAATIAMLVGATPASAGVIVNDTWQDGTDTDPASPAYSEYGVDSDLDGDLESVWFQGGDGTLNPVGPGGPERGTFSSPTGTSSATWTTYFTPEATPVTLANAGDNLKVTWVFTPTNINNGGNNTSQNFRFAIFDSPAAQRLAANGAPASGAYTGYAMFANMSNTLGNSNPFRLMRRNVANSDLLSTSGNWTPLANGATTGADGYDSGTEYTLEWMITRNAASGLEHLVTMTGGTLNNSGTAQVSFTDATPGTMGGFTFDAFAIRPSGALTTAEQFDTSLFRVESNTVEFIPEPVSLLLFGLGAMGLAIVRRRRGC